jgi:hypothetical protein
VGVGLFWNSQAPEAALAAQPAPPKAQPAIAAKPPAPPPEDPGLAAFHKTIEPILQDRCYDCHSGPDSKAGIAFDELKTKEQILQNPELWLKVLKNTRAHIMPPADSASGAPSPEQQLALEQWIKTAGFALNPAQPDPGQVTVRRLNRTEYRNTIRDLIGVDFDVEHELAADDTGYGFDDISDVLTLSPMRMEKFIEAAQAIVKKGVPAANRAVTEQLAPASEFLTDDGTRTADPISFYEELTVSHTYTARVAGDYRIIISSQVDGNTDPDPGLCTVTGLCDGKEFYRHDHHWADCEFFREERTVHLEAGTHQISFHLQPLLPPERKVTPKMNYKLSEVQVDGPLDPKDWLPPANYARFFSRPEAPADPAARRAYAREVLANFAAKAYRRPVDAPVLDRLVKIAEAVYTLPGNTFENGISRAMVAILASPRFLFRFEQNTPVAPGATVANIDDYSLASRLSYFLWSSMPDDELFDLAAKGQLRQNLAAQVQRMMADPKAAAFVQNFTEQWLRSREIMSISLNIPIIQEREGIRPQPPRRGGGGQAAPTDLTPEQREALKDEASAYFNYVARENRDVIEFIDSDYVFRNEALAAYYGMPADTVKGPAMQKITLAADDPRGGGVLTMASTLAVTSNPTRTSPVKRGKWILENILGAPAPPPPPAVPALEETEKKISDHTPTQRELLAIHRADALCASCHERMDPLGLALENFNALGLYRTQELDQPVDATGTLMTGESFTTIRELQHILATQHREEFYRTLTEKLLVYALGRGLEYYDVPTVDKIVGRLEQGGGHFSELLMGIVESAPFLQTRAGVDAAPPAPALLVTSNPAIP